MAGMKRNLTTFEAACIVAGNGIGGGLMALPYLSAHVRITGTVFVLLVAWLFPFAGHWLVIQYCSLRSRRRRHYLKSFVCFTAHSKTDILCHCRYRSSFGVKSARPIGKIYCNCYDGIRDTLTRVFSVHWSK